MATTFNKAIPLFFFLLASNAFSDIWFVGRIKKKKISQEVLEALVPQGDVKG